MFYVYILQTSKDKSYYTGYTTDLKKQFKNIVRAAKNTALKKDLLN